MLLNILSFNICKSTLHPLLTLPEITSLYAPQGAEAAATNKIVVKNGKAAVKSKNIYIGGKVVDFDAVVKGKHVKDSKGTWKSSNKKIASVDKNGKVKALKNGKVTISFKTKATKKVKSVTVKMTINARTRASKMILTPAAVVVKEGEKSTVGVSYEISKKIQAAGGKTTTYKLFAESSDEKAAKVSVEGNDKIVVEGVAKSATPVSITVYAAQVTNIAKAKEVKIKLTEKFDVKVNSKLEAKQTGANKITVMGSGLIASAGAYVIKSSTGAPLKLSDKVEVNEAGTEAVLYGDTTYLPAGTYTLSYQGSEPVDLTIVREVVKGITLDPVDKAILVSSKSAVAYYKVLNQFDEDITQKFSSSNVVIAGSDDARKGTLPGTIEFKNPVGYQLGLSKVSVSIVDTATGVHTEGILTISEESKIVEAKFEGIYNKSTREFVKDISDIEDKETIKNYYLVFSGVDQYGHTVTQTNDYLNKSVHTRGGIGSMINVILLSTTGLTNEPIGNLDTINGHKYITYQLNLGTNTSLRAGEVNLQAIAINSGKSVSNKFNVASSVKVDKLTIREGAMGVFDGQDNELEFEALDQNGKPIKDWAILKNLNDMVYHNRNGAEVRFEKKDDGTVGLFFRADNYVPDGTRVGAVKVISYITETNKFVNAQITIKPDRYPAAIIGFRKGFATGVTRSIITPHAISITAQDLRYQDQYGNEMNAKEIFGNARLNNKYTVTLTEASNSRFFKVAASSAGVNVKNVAKDNVFLTVDAVSDGAITDPAKKISDQTGDGRYKFTLTGDKLDDLNNKVKSDFEFNLYNVRLADMRNFKFADHNLDLKEVRDPEDQSWPDVNSPVVNLKHVGGTLTSGTWTGGKDYTHATFAAVVVGNYAGETVKLVPNDDYIAFASAEGTATTDTVDVKVPSKDYLGKDVVSKDAGVRAIVKNGIGTEVNDKYTYSKALRVVADVSFKDEYDNNGRIIKGRADGDNAVIDWTELSKYLDVTDQYGNPIDMKPYITFKDFTVDPSNANKGVDGAYASITKNGEKGAAFTFKKGMGSTISNGMQVVTLRLTFPRSTYVFEKSIRISR